MSNDKLLFHTSGDKTLLCAVYHPCIAQHMLLLVNSRANALQQQSLGQLQEQLLVTASAVLQWQALKQRIKANTQTGCARCISNID